MELDGEISWIRQKVQEGLVVSPPAITLSFGFALVAVAL